MSKLHFCILIALVGLFSFNSCTPKDEKFISEGSIEYTATVVDRNSSMATLAPNKMTVKFKKNNYCGEMSAGMGLFYTSFIFNNKTKTLTQLVKLLNKKFYVIQNDKEINKENEKYNFEIKLTDSTKVIAGYTCKKAIVHCKKENTTDFTIYYTSDLDIENPNFATPFGSIKGVLMEYQLKKFGLELRFTAKSVTREDINDEVFEIPNDYKKITQKEMNDLFESFQ